VAPGGPAERHLEGRENIERGDVLSHLLGDASLALPWKLFFFFVYRYDSMKINSTIHEASLVQK